ncbi:MAG: penicillin-binding protein 1A [Syntrophomonadaceae bacterium]|nr:penicillin-binding protein 1A [Syntrophomonadaceae bacterium]
MAKNNSNNKKRRINWKNIFLFFAILGLIGMGAIVGVSVFAAQDMPAWDPQQLSGAKTTFIYDDKGEIVFNLHAEENRTEVTLDKVPQDLIDAFIATEDQDFYDHFGINIKGIMRAVVSNITSGDLKGQGASTITQQLARNAFLSFDKNWERKIKEVLLAFKLESNFSKDEILTMYLNKINFGAGAYGVQAAANTYFGKDVSDLTLAEASLLAGLPQSPNGYNPFQHYERAKARQKIVLNNMVNCGYIDEATAKEAYDTPLVFKQTTSVEQRYGYFIDAVIEEAIDIITENNLYDDPNDAVYRYGLRIYTTMDKDIQSHVENLYANPENFPNQSVNGELIQSAMVVIDHSNGQVKAIMGGRKYEQRRGFNRATSAYRQPGSVIKPIAVYAPALEKGIMPYYVLDDSPISIKIGNEIWSPRNYDGGHRGLVTMRTAVEWSINTYAVQMLDQIGIRTGFDYAKAMGLELIDTPGTNDLGLAPLSLGGLTKGATPLQMAAAYGTIANGGLYTKPHFITRIVDVNGVEVYKYEPTYERVLTEQTSWLMTNILQSVVSSGTGTSAKVPGVPTAGKTGTSEQYMDSWFCGFTPAYSVAVWMGYDKEYTMNKVYGSGYPARIFRSTLQKAHEGKNVAPKSMPAGITQVTVCSKSGKLPSEKCPQEQIITDYSLQSSIPTEVCDIHEEILICPESGKLAGRYCPNPQLASLVATNENSATPDAIPNEKCDIHNDFSIQGMLRNEIYICTDPRHDGKIYRANVPTPIQNNGCPSEYIQKIIVSPGQDIPYCNLKDHEIKNKKARDIINDIID